MLLAQTGPPSPWRASACYPFATQPDFGVAADANNHDGIGITLHLRVRVFVNRTLVDRVGMSALCQKQPSEHDWIPQKRTSLQVGCVPQADDQSSMFVAADQISNSRPISMICALGILK